MYSWRIYLVLSFLSFIIFMNVDCGSKADLSSMAKVGDVTITVVDSYYWRDWMPDVSDPGPDGGSPLNVKIQIRLDNTLGADTFLFFNITVCDKDNHAHPVALRTPLGKDKRDWDGSLAAGEIKTIELRTSKGPYIAAGSRIRTVVNWKDKNGNKGSVATQDLKIHRTF
jgi:hypothetical protein